MNKDTLINLRITKTLKDDFQIVCENEGYTMSEVIEASMIDIVSRNNIPINIRSKIQKKKRMIINIPFIKQCVDNYIYQNKENKIQSVSLFGSYAKGLAKANSDIDLFVDFDDDATLFDVSNLQRHLEKETSKKIDIATNKENISFYNHIQKERIKLYERGLVSP